MEIAGWEKDSVDISGTKYGASEALRDSIKIDIVATADTIRIRTVRPYDRRGNLGARYVIRVPRKTELDPITSSNGSMKVEGVEGVARLRTSNGSVRTVKLRGNLEVSTSNASIDVVDLDGPANVKTSNGRVSAEGVRGAFEATTSNGGIRAHLAKSEARRPVRLETSNGGIELTMDSANENDVRASTSNGGITLRLPDTIGARVRAHTSNASISTEFDVRREGSTSSRNHLEGTIGAGGPTLDLSTSNGSIRLLKLSNEKLLTRVAR